MDAGGPSQGRVFRERGDRQAFAILVTPHLDALFTLCMRMLGNRGEAEDVAQDALVRALEHHSHYDDSRPFRPWLLAIAANLCRDRVRGGWWRGLARRLVGPATPETIDPVDGAEQDALVHRALAALPEHYREALALFHLEGMTYLEMAAITGIGVSALKQRVHRGNALLEAELRRLCPARVVVRTVGQESP